MNTYLMSIVRYFGGTKTFTIEAEDKQDAIVKGLEFVKQNPMYASGGNYDLKSVRCVKKVQKKPKL